MWRVRLDSLEGVSVDEQALGAFCSGDGEVVPTNDRADQGGQLIRVESDHYFLALISKACSPVEALAGQKVASIA